MIFYARVMESNESKGMMQGKVVTIFRGSGFIGRYVVEKLAKAGAEIRVAVRNPDKALYLKTMGEIGQITPIFVNVTHEESVAQVLSGADYAINLVGILFEWRRQKFDRIHVLGAQTIAKVAANVGVKRLVHVSSIGADSHSNARYLASKGQGEQQVRTYFPEATILRPSIVFGQEDQFFNRFALLARFSPFLPLFGGGSTKFQPAYVGDIAHAVLKILSYDKTSESPYVGKTYELGGPHIYTYKEIMELILRETRHKRLLLKMPFLFATVAGAFLQYLPQPLITPDQVRMLKQDNVVCEQALTFKDLDIEPTSVELIVPTYLKRYRYHG